MTHAIEADGGGCGVVTPQFYESSDGPDKAGILMGSLVRVRVGDNWGGRVRVRVHGSGMIVIDLVRGERDGSGFFLRQLDEDKEADAAGRRDKPVAGILEDVSIRLCEGHLEDDGGEGMLRRASAKGEGDVGLLLHGGWPTAGASGCLDVVGTSVEMNLVVFVKAEELDQEHEAVHPRA